jgi:hypothetical protein
MRLAIAVLLLLRGAAFALDCPREGATSPTALCVQLAMRNGQIAAGEHALSTMSPGMARLKSPAQNQLQAFALKIVEDVLGRLAKPYPMTAGLSDFTDSWAKFVELLGPMLQDGRAVTDPLDPRLGVLGPLLTLSENSGVRFVDTAFDLAAGLATFEIVDPFDSTAVAIDFLPPLTPAKTISRKRDLRGVLQGLDGQLWCGACYVQPIVDYYARRDLSAQVIPSRAENNGLQVTEGKRIADIDISGVDAGDREKVAWAVLTTGDFGKWRKLPAPGPAIRYKEDLGYETIALPYLVQSQLELQQLALAQIGYAFGKPRDLTGATLELIVASTQDRQPDADAPQAARPAIDPQRGIVGPQPTVAEQTPGGNLAENREASPPKLTRYIAPGIEYRPGQALRAFITGELQNLPKPWPTTITFTGGYPFGTLGSVSASSDYVGMSTIHMPLSLSARASATRTLRRYLNGAKLDETRTGPSGRAELEVFRDRGGSLLRLYGELQHTTVGLTGVGGVDKGKANLNVVEAGGLYWYHAADKELPTWILARPVVRAGTGLSQTEPVYATGRVDAQIWQAYRHGLGSFVALHGGVATQGTPVFEALSFGGSESVRGFRTDDAIARRTWSVQAEARLPFPVRRPADGKGVASMLSQLKLAPLFDIGGAYQTIGSEPGTRSGVGLGLRLKISFVEFGLDWAYATLGHAATGGSRGKFYFSIKTILPY